MFLRWNIVLKPIYDKMFQIIKEIRNTDNKSKKTQQILLIQEIYKLRITNLYPPSSLDVQIYILGIVYGKAVLRKLR